MDYISYNELQSDDTGFSRLFIDYITNYSHVKNFFSGDFRDDTHWRSTLEAVSIKSEP
jgi:hypothetical protein